MNRKMRSKTFSLALVLGMLVGGCSTAESSARNVPTVMIALNIAGGGRPSPEQAALVQQSLAGAMAKAGLQFARSADDADYIVTATLTPDPVNPKQGHIKISRIEPARRVESEQPNALRASRSADAMTSEAKAQQERLRQLEAWSQSTDARTDYGR
jgi:hypothetical protein